MLLSLSLPYAKNNIYTDPLMLIPCHFLYNFSFSTLNATAAARWATSFFPPPSFVLACPFHIIYFFSFSKFLFIIQFLGEWWRKKMLQDLDHHHHYFPFSYLLAILLSIPLYWGIFPSLLYILVLIFIFFFGWVSSHFILRDVRLLFSFLPFAIFRNFVCA